MGMPCACYVLSLLFLSGRRVRKGDLQSHRERGQQGLSIHVCVATLGGNCCSNVGLHLADAVVHELLGQPFCGEAQAFFVRGHRIIFVSPSRVKSKERLLRKWTTNGATSHGARAATINNLKNRSPWPGENSGKTKSACVLGSCSCLYCFPPCPPFQC